jgi:hypothetical protein
MDQELLRRPRGGGARFEPRRGPVAHLRPLRSLTDDELLRRLRELLASSRRVEAELVAHIGEVDERRLYARAASPSMFAYCTDRLGLSEAEAYFRIAAARASRVHPELLAMLADGRLHLSGIAKLAPHLRAENRQALLSRAAHKSKREIEELIAEMFPRPDAPASIRKLPVRRYGDGPSLATTAGRGLPPREALSAVPLMEVATAAPAVLAAGGNAALGTRTKTGSAAEPRPCAGEASASSAVPPVEPGLQRRRSELKPVTAARSDAQTLASSRELRPDRVDLAAGAAGRIELRPDGVGLAPAIAPKGALGQDGGALVAVGPGAKRALTFAPLAPARYRVQFTASAGLREKLERLRALMLGSVPDGDLAAIIEDAVTEKLQRLETRRFGRTRKPKGDMLPGAEAGKTRGARPLGAEAGKARGDEAIAGAARANTSGAGRAGVGEPQGKAAGYVTRGGLTPCDLPPPTRHIPAAVRRAVSERDGDRCCFVDAEGRRCTARHRLEFHHRFPFGYGGGHSVDNIRLVCRAHNRYLAAIDYGKGMGSGTIGATGTSADDCTGVGSRSGSDSGSGEG